MLYTSAIFFVLKYPGSHDEYVTQCQFHVCMSNGSVADSKLDFTGHRAHRKLMKLSNKRRIYKNVSCFVLKK